MDVQCPCTEYTTNHGVTISRYTLYSVQNNTERDALRSTELVVRLLLLRAVRSLRLVSSDSLARVRVSVSTEYTGNFWFVYSGLVRVQRIPSVADFLSDRRKAVSTGGSADFAGLSARVHTLL